MVFDLELLSDPIGCFYFLNTRPSHKYSFKMVAYSIKTRKRKTWTMGPLLAGEEGWCPPADHPMGICKVSAWLAVARVCEGLGTH